MSDSFTETTTISWFTRLKNALVGILIGIALVIGSIVGIFWNEHRAVQTARSLAEGRGLVIDVDAQKPDPANNGRLVHVAGQASAAAPLLDPDFGVSGTGLRLVRTAEMYQWKEEEHTETTKNVGGSETKTTTYTYSKTWSTDAIDSSRFKRPQDHGNPPKTVAGREIYARDASSAASRSTRRSCPAPERRGAAGLERYRRDAEGEEARRQDIRWLIYVGDDPSVPRIGDLRISYELAPAGPVSVIAAQSGTGFSPYQTAAGDKLAMLRPGIMTAPQMFAAAEEENFILTWALRAALMLGIWLGTFLIVRPLAVFADLIPFVGSIVGFGLGSAALLVALIVGPTAIAIAAFAFRPVVSAIVHRGRRRAAFGWHRLRSGRAPAQAAARRGSRALEVCGIGLDHAACRHRMGPQSSTNGYGPGKRST